MYSLSLLSGGVAWSDSLSQHNWSLWWDVQKLVIYCIITNVSIGASDWLLHWQQWTSRGWQYFTQSWGQPSNQGNTIFRWAGLTAKLPPLIKNIETVENLQVVILRVGTEAFCKKTHLLLIRLTNNGNNKKQRVMKGSQFHYTLQGYRLVRTCS